MHTARIARIIWLRFGSELYLARALFINPFGRGLALLFAGVGRGAWAIIGAGIGP